MRSLILGILMFGFFGGVIFTLYFLFSGAIAAAIGCLVILTICTLILHEASS